MKSYITFILILFFQCAIAQDEYSKEDLIAIVAVSTDSINSGSKDVAFYYDLRGSAHYKLGNYNKAIEDFNAYLSIDQKNAEIYNKLGDVFFDKGEYQRAIDEYNKAIKVKPLGHSFISRGVAYQNLSKYDQAALDYNKALRFSDYKVMALENLAILNKMTNNIEMAVKNFTDLIEHEPTNSNYYYDRALLYMKLDQYSKAINDFSSGIELKPEYNFYLMRGYSYALNKNFSEAFDDFMKAYQLDSNNHYLYYYRGLAYKLNENYDLACKDLRRAKKLGVSVKNDLLINCK
jgi:tetratricopeptide (TPR) repeat protein